MNLNRLFTLGLRSLVAVTALTAVATATAQPYPSKPIKIIVITGPGTASDSTARYLASGMTKVLNTPVIVENRPGASGVIATEAVAKSPADGHTLLLTFSSHFINQWTMKPPYDAVNDFEPIARLNRSTLVLTTAASSPFKSVADVVAAAKRNPGKVSYATAGGVTEMAGALMGNLAGVRINHALYKEPSRVIIDSSSGVVDMAFTGLTAAFPLIESGRVRALAVTTSTRASQLPGVPTLAEAGLPGYEMSSTVMVLAPKGTPPTVVSKLSSVITQLATEEGFKELCRIQVCDVEILDSGALKAAAPAELEKWRRLVELTKTQTN